MKTLTWVDTTRKAIKSILGFGWSVQGIEKQNRVVTKVAYRFASGQRTTVLEEANDFKYDKKLQEARKALREDDMEAKRTGGGVDWDYLLSRVDS